MSESIFNNNVEAIEAWNTVLFEKFLQYRPILTTGLSQHGEAVLEFNPPQKGWRVLDIGCGFGDTTQAIARRVGAQGEAVGIDAAARFIEVAKKEAAEAKVLNARFLVGDVQEANLGGPYQQAFSRFGIMFVANPVATFRNLRKYLTPGGLLSLVVWRRKDENPFLSLVEQKVLEIIPQPEKGEQVTCGPGPFAMASPDVVSAQLRAAGFARVGFERFDCDICVGKDIDEAVRFAMTLGPAGEIIRLAGEEGEKRKPQVVSALKELLAKFLKADGVYGASSSWIITARLPN